MKSLSRRTLLQGTGAAVALPFLDAMVPAGFAKSADTIFVGLDGSVEALAADSGERLWQAPVGGKAYGLAIASGRLFVSTDRGEIHCFAPAK